MRYDSILLVIERCDFFSDHIVHIAECGSNILVLGSGFVTGMMFSMSADACCAEANHTGV
jgi:hypothetical protein